MDWGQAIDGYCERVGPGYWAEPLNLVSNLAFLVAAFLAWRRAEGDRGGRLLAAVLGLIGAGSWLFHAHAQRWALYADVVPIQLFILLYVGLATVRFFAVPWWAGVAAAAAFLPFAALVTRAAAAVFGPLNGSVGYLPVPLLIAGYAAALSARAPATARGLGVGAGLLCLSLVFRTADAAVCPAWPAGTHFLWHLVNAAMLGWMVLVLVRHDDRPAPRGS